MSWYQKSRAFIYQQKIENPTLRHYQLKEHCSTRYPFGKRKGWKYEMFLKAMREEFGRARTRPTLKGQMDLFNK